MKITIITVIAAVALLTSCGEAALTPETAAKKWCELNDAVKSAEGEAKDAAKEARKKFEGEVKDLFEDVDGAKEKIREITKECD